MFFVFKNPFKYAVAGYGVFNCVKGGVIKNIVGFKITFLENFDAIYRKYFPEN